VKGVILAGGTGPRHRHSLGHGEHQVADGIPAGHPVRTVREDPGRDGLLFAGTEFGVFVSFDAGDTWQSFQRNLPVTPVTGMRVAHDDLILSTQGRSFWIMDDISPLREIEEAVAAGTHLFQPRDVRRLTNLGTPGLAELNPEPAPPGVPHSASSAVASPEPAKRITLAGSKPRETVPPTGGSGI